ncbi:hypothetical protein GQ55_4G210700 [Panicum hallii var. hallii]|uniref:Uncharacterized protein n=1 Tax=Panicum hallii var. hallii TaxID=1504633 RepID=A0A2T7DZ97_9POAL|nr:hypothetical protein GQ55_4G210700 [Panicum hallii var. hallii]
MPQPIRPLATPGLAQILQPVASGIHSPALPDISTSFRTPTSALLGQYATTHTPSASVSAPVSTGGLAESSVTRQLKFSYSEITGLTTPSTHTPVGPIDSAQPLSVAESSVAPALAAVTTEAPPRVSAPEVSIEQQTVEPSTSVSDPTTAVRVTTPSPESTSAPPPRLW